MNLPVYFFLAKSELENSPFEFERHLYEYIKERDEVDAHR